MTKKLFILCAIGLVGCASLPPLDDAYFWPDKKAQTVATTPAPVATDQQKTTPTAASAPAKPAMEIISQKDTTITVRIKK